MMQVAGQSTQIVSSSPRDIYLSHSRYQKREAINLPLNSGGQIAQTCASSYNDALQQLHCTKVLISSRVSVPKLWLRERPKLAPHSGPGISYLSACCGATNVQQMHSFHETSKKPVKHMAKGKIFVEHVTAEASILHSIQSMKFRCDHSRSTWDSQD
jgi:hypothetical protein